MGRDGNQTLELHKSDGNRPQWYVRYKIYTLDDDGKRKRVETRKYLGFVDEVKRAEAVKKRDALRGTVNMGEVIVQSQTKMKDFLNKYGETFIPTLKPNSQPVYRSKIQRFILPAFGEFKVCEINSESVGAFLNRLGPQYARETVRGIRSVLSSVMEVASDWGYTEARNPCKKKTLRLPRCKAPSTTLRALTLDEVRRLFAVADSMRPPLADVVRVAIFCGLRIGEILALTWADYAPPILRVWRSRSQWGGVMTEPKSRAGVRDVPLGPVILRRPSEAADGDRIFGVEYNFINRDLHRALDAAGIKIKGTSLHSLRRTFASMRKQAGARQMREVMGHSKESMSDRYVYQTVDEESALTFKMAELIAGEVTGRKM